MTTSPAARVRTLTEFHLRRVKDQAAELRRQTYPAEQDGSDILFSLIDGFLDSASEHIRQLDHHDPESTPYKNYLNSAGDYIYIAYEYLDTLRRASAEEIYHPIVAPIIQWLKCLGMDRSILFQAENVANYEVEFFSDWFTETNMDLFRQKSPSLTAAINRVRKKNLTVFTVPRSAFAVLPHFAIVAHEIGHVLYQPISDSVIDEIRSFTDKIIKRTTAQVKTKNISFDNRKEGFLRESLDSWGEEYAADAIASRLTGPAAYFALSDLFQYSGVKNLPTDSHPIPSDRLSAYYNSLTKGSFNFKKVIESNPKTIFSNNFNNIRLGEKYNFDETVEALIRIYDYDYDQSVILACLGENASNLSRKVYKVVCRRFDEDHKEQIYHPEDLRANLKEFLENLLNAIPPIEYGKPLENETEANFVSILNVGWIALLCRIKDFDVNVSETSDHLQNGAKSELLHDLLLKAVELSEARRKWTMTRNSMNSEASSREER